MSKKCWTKQQQHQKTVLHHQVAGYKRHLQRRQQGQQKMRPSLASSKVLPTYIPLFIPLFTINLPILTLFARHRLIEWLVTVRPKTFRHLTNWLRKYRKPYSMLCDNSGLNSAISSFYFEHLSTVNYWKDENKDKRPGRTHFKIICCI